MDKSYSSPSFGCLYPPVQYNISCLPEIEKWRASSSFGLISKHMDSINVVSILIILLLCFAFSWFNGKINLKVGSVSDLQASQIFASIFLTCCFLLFRWIWIIFHQQLYASSYSTSAQMLTRLDKNVSFNYSIFSFFLYNILSRLYSICWSSSNGFLKNKYQVFQVSLINFFKWINNDSFMQSDCLLCTMTHTTHPFQDCLRILSEGRIRDYE